MLPAISVRGVARWFGPARALEDATLDVRPGELFALLGPSGSGKSTLLRVIAGFERPDRGTVAIAGRGVAGAGVWVEPERRRIGMVFQDDALFPHLTVARNVGFGVRDDADRVRWMRLAACRLTADGITAPGLAEARAAHAASATARQDAARRVARQSARWSQRTGAVPWDVRTGTLPFPAAG